MKIIRLLAFPFTVLYAVGIWLRNKAFDWKIIQAHKFDIPIICVGNLSVGGTGKSTHIEYLVELLRQNFKIAILSRGYKRVSEGYLEANENSRVFEIGDEPMQFFKKFDNVVVAVDKNRVNGIKEIVKNHPDVKAILLDDAYQHRFVHPGINILLTKYSKMYCDDFLLPTGSLREPAACSKRADFIIVTKTPDILSPLDERRIKTHLRPKSYQQIYFSYQVYDILVPISKSCESIHLEKPETNFSVFLVTGIADSSTLNAYLMRHFKEVKELKFPDHHLYNENDILKIEKEFNDFFPPNKFIITTEKDAMRFMMKDLKELIDRIPIFYIPVKVELHDKVKEYFNEEIIEYVRTGKRSNSVD